MKVLGISLATVASLGAIGGISAAVISKQNHTVQTVNTNEENSAKLSDQKDKKENKEETLDKEVEIKNSLSTDEKENNVQSDKTISVVKEEKLLANEKAPDKLLIGTKEVNKEGFKECSSQPANNKGFCSVL